MPVINGMTIKILIKLIIIINIFIDFELIDLELVHSHVFFFYVLL